MNKRTILRLCLPHSAARAGRVHPLLLARALLRRPGRQGQLNTSRHTGRVEDREGGEDALELPQVEHLGHVEHIEYCSALALPAVGESDAEAAGARVSIRTGEQR